MLVSHYLREVGEPSSSLGVERRDDGKQKERLRCKQPGSVVAHCVGCRGGVEGPKPLLHAVCAAYQVDRRAD
jgi:hypothetical protein